MLAWRLEADGSFGLTEVERPTPLRGEILVRAVTAAAALVLALRVGANHLDARAGDRGADEDEGSAP